MAEQDLLITPRALYKKTGGGKLTSPLRKRSVSPITNSKNFWSSLKEYNSKYEWMTQVYDAISDTTGDKLSLETFRYIELCLENFVDNYLNEMSVDGFEPENFGNEVLYEWFGFEQDAIESDEKLVELRDDLQNCFDSEIITITEDSSDVSRLFIKICTVCVIKFLEQSVRNMIISINNPDVLTLFYCIYTAQYDNRFFMFMLEEYLEKDIIPQDPSNQGVTIAMLHENLAIFIKKNYDEPPLLENGILDLLAGCSNIIVINDKSTELISNLSVPLIEIPNNKELTIFFNLHRYILYLIFEEIQTILKTKEDHFWTCGIVIDAINTVAIQFRREIGV